MSENRRGNYKFGAKGDKDARRKDRQDNSIQLRKNAREEQMLKRRNVCMGESFFQRLFSFSFSILTTIHNINIVSIIIRVLSIINTIYRVKPVLKRNLQNQL